MDELEAKKRICLFDNAAKAVTPANDNAPKKDDFWDARSGSACAEDRRQIGENIVGFFTILVEWSSLPVAANDNKPSLPPDPKGER